MRKLALLALVLACRKYATDGDALDGSAKPGELARARFFHNTTCAANASGVVRCFSSCNQVIYGMGSDLATVERTKVPIAACTGVVDELGNTTIVGDGALVTLRTDGSIANVPAPELKSARRAVGGHGRVAIITERGGLAVFSTSTGARLWGEDNIQVRGIAMRPDGGVVVTGRGVEGFVRSLSPEGHVDWVQTAATVGGVAVGPHGEIAVIESSELEMLDANGQIRWGRGIAGDAELATDGTDIYVAGAGEAATESNGYLTRTSSSGTVWTASLVGPSPEPRILAVTPDSVVLEVPVYPYELDPDKGDPDHATTGIGDAVMKTDGTGKLIAKIAR